MTTTTEDKLLVGVLVTGIFAFCAIFIIFGNTFGNTVGNNTTQIDDYVKYCKLDYPHTCLDASFNNSIVKIATNGTYNNIMLSACDHTQHARYNNGVEIVDIYTFECFGKNNYRDISIDGEIMGEIIFTNKAKWV